MAEAADYTFFATDSDPEKGLRACRRLADAFAGGRDPRSEDIREAMATSTAAFPGLQEFVDAMDERGLDPGGRHDGSEPGRGRTRRASAGGRSEAGTDRRHGPSGRTFRLARRGRLRKILPGGIPPVGGVTQSLPATLPPNSPGRSRRARRAPGSLTAPWSDGPRRPGRHRGVKSCNGLLNCPELFVISAS